MKMHGIMPNAISEMKRKMNDRYNPTISIAMATYNGELYLREQLESIIPYLCQNDEIIISDDGSTDQTISLINKFKSQYGIIKILDGPHKGVVKNFENAVKNTTKDIIMFADQDDVWLPNKIPFIKHVFKQHPDIKLVLHDMYICTNEQIKNKECGFRDFDARKRRHGVIYNILYSGYYGCCMSFTREFKNMILPFSTNVNAYDQWVGLIAEKKNVSFFLKEPLIIHRNHGSNLTHHLSIVASLKFKVQLLMSYLNYLRFENENNSSLFGWYHY